MSYSVCFVVVLVVVVLIGCMFCLHVLSTSIALVVAVPASWPIQMQIAVSMWHICMLLIFIFYYATYTS